MPSLMAAQLFTLFRKNPTYECLKLQAIVFYCWKTQNRFKWYKPGESSKRNTIKQKVKANPF